jgi:type I restriction enzyme, S subunit
VCRCGNRAERRCLVRIRDLRSQEPGVSIPRAAAFPPEVRVWPGDLLIGMDGEFSCAIWRKGEAVLNQRMCKVRSRRSDLFDDGYLYLWFRPILTRLGRIAGATTVKHISLDELRKLRIKIPPLETQEHLSALGSQLDAVCAGWLRRRGAIRSLRQEVVSEVCG